LLYAILLLCLSPLHNKFIEWGGVMQYFAGKEILSGTGYHGWPSHFWPPLFSLLIGLGSLVLPGFLAGKLISIFAASVLLFVAFLVAQEIFHRQELGVWVQVFLALSPIFVYETLEAHNHMLDSVLFMTGFYLFLRSLRDPKPGRFLIAGLVCGLAGLTRYTSYVLLALPIFVLIFKPRFRAAVTSGVAFWIGFAVVSLPWWYANTLDNGSPIASWQHLNICTSIIAHNPGANCSLWWCSNQNLAHTADIVAAYPIEYLKNFARNIYRSGVLLITYGGVLAPFVLPAILESIFLVELRHWIVTFGVLSLSVCLVSQAFVNQWYYLGWMVPIIVITTTFVLKYLDRIADKYPILNRYLVRQMFLALLVLAGLGLTFNRLATRLASERDYSPAAEIDQVTRALQEHDPDLQSKVVMAIDPARAYYAGSKYLMTPLDYEGSLAGLVAYTGVSEQVKNYAPKYPSSLAKSGLRADYLIYTKASEIWLGEQEPPQFSFLFDPHSNEIPGNFELIYQSPNVVAYEINW
jgi:hypothetical protein